MLVAGMRHVLSSQIHRRFNSERAPTTTQRRLKRLSDAGLLQRFQLYRRDGGGVPMCYEVTLAGLELLHAHERASALQAEDVATPSRSPSRTAASVGEHMLRQARHDVHVTGWVLALEQVLDRSRVRIHGCRESILSPPQRQGPGRSLSARSAQPEPAGRTHTARVRVHRRDRSESAGRSFRDGSSSMRRSSCCRQVRQQGWV